MKNKNLDKEINAITIKIKRGTWELFKSVTPSNITLNQAVVNLINKKVQENTKDATDEEIDQFFKKKKGRPENKYQVA